MEEEVELDYGFDEPDDDPTWDRVLTRINSPSPIPEEFTEIAELNLDELECVDEEVDDDKLSRGEHMDSKAARERRSPVRSRRNDREAVRRTTSPSAVEWKRNDAKVEKTEPFSLLEQRKASLKDLEAREALHHHEFAKLKHGERRRRRVSPRSSECKLSRSTERIRDPERARAGILDSRELWKRKDELRYKRIHDERNERERYAVSPRHHRRRSPINDKSHNKKEHSDKKNANRRECSTDRDKHSSDPTRKDHIEIPQSNISDSLMDAKESRNGMDSADRKKSQEKNTIESNIRRSSERQDKDCTRIYRNGFLVVDTEVDKRSSTSHLEALDSRRKHFLESKDRSSERFYATSRDHALRKKIECSSSTLRSVSSGRCGLKEGLMKNIPRREGKFNRINDSDSSDSSDSDSNSREERQLRSPFFDSLATSDSRTLEDKDISINRSSSSYCTPSSTSTHMAPLERTFSYGHDLMPQEKNRRKGERDRGERVHKGIQERDEKLRHIAEKVRKHKRIRSEELRQGEVVPDVISIEGPLSNGWCTNEPDTTPRSESAMLRSPSPTVEEKSPVYRDLPLRSAVLTGPPVVCTDINAEAPKTPDERQHSVKESQVSRSIKSLVKASTHEQRILENTLSDEGSHNRQTSSHQERSYNDDKSPHHFVYSPSKEEKWLHSPTKQHVGRPIISRRSSSRDECRNPTLEMASPNKDRDRVRNNEDVRIALAAITTIRNAPQYPRKPDGTVPSLSIISPMSSRHPISHSDIAESTDEEPPKKKTRVPILAPSSAPAKHHPANTKKIIKLPISDISKISNSSLVRPHKQDDKYKEKLRDPYPQKNRVIILSTQSNMKRPKEELQREKHQTQAERNQRTPITAPRSTSPRYKYKPKDWHEVAISSVIPTVGSRIPITIEGLDVPKARQKVQCHDSAKSSETLEVHHFAEGVKESNNYNHVKLDSDPEPIQAEDLQITTKSRSFNNIFAKAIQATTRNVGLTAPKAPEPVKEKKWNPQIKLKKQLLKEEPTEEMHRKIHARELITSSSAHRNETREVIFSPSPQREVLIDDSPRPTRKKHRRNSDFMCTINNTQFVESPLKLDSEDIIHGDSERVIVFDLQEKAIRKNKNKKKKKCDTLTVIM